MFTYVSCAGVDRIPRRRLALCLAHSCRCRTPAGPAARGTDFSAVCAAADELRRRVCGDAVSFVVNRNINYTNVCTYACSFCAFRRAGGGGGGLVGVAGRFPFAVEPGRGWGCLVSSSQVVLSAALPWASSSSGCGDWWSKPRARTLASLPARSKGKAAEELRGAPYLLPLEEVTRRAAEAWDRGATEVCMQVSDSACTFRGGQGGCQPAHPRAATAA